MKNTLCAILLAVAMTAGCAVKAHFYPVQGPIMSQTPLPVPTAKISYGVKPHDLTVVLPGGEVCKGHWTVVQRGEIPGRTDAKDGATPQMQADWDAVYGAGYYVAHVLGTKYYARTTANGNKGTVLHVELYVSGNEHDQGGVRGIARDNRDNLYKLTLD